MDIQELLTLYDEKVGKLNEQIKEKTQKIDDLIQQ
jgi:hypothetical protein